MSAVILAIIVLELKSTPSSSSSWLSCSLVPVVLGNGELQNSDESRSEASEASEEDADEDEDKDEPEDDIVLELLGVY